MVINFRHLTKSPQCSKFQKRPKLKKFHEFKKNHKKFVKISLNFDSLKRCSKFQEILNISSILFDLKFQEILKTSKIVGNFLFKKWWKIFN